jgi:GT2 family glycosyltransferase
MIPTNAQLSGWPFRLASEEPLPKHLPSGRPWPRISVVTPSFNQGAYLEETLLSVARQGYPDVEHIVIDGGSSDETLTVLERHSSRLAYVVSEPDGGQAHAINKGFTRATGEILTWLNSDDLLAPGALAAVALAFETSGADLVAGVASLFSGDRFLAHHLTSCADGPLPLAELLDLEGCWLAGQFFYQPEVVFSRRIWERAGGTLREDLHYSMDYDLWVRFAEQGARLHAIGRPVAWYRVHSEQKTSLAANYEAELRRWRSDYSRSHPEVSAEPHPAAPPARRRPGRPPHPNASWRRSPRPATRSCRSHSSTGRTECHRRSRPRPRSFASRSRRKLRTSCWSATSTRPKDTLRSSSRWFVATGP